ncbi:MAG TPA: adenylate/guanylate cyclase domain-containing protein [Polyangiaceae bacterium]|nr:adenylate/guanylate cyclase domain-containing protein [Polyangiaceae bacterium]
MLREVASAVNASLDLPEVLRRVLDAMRDAFGFEHSRVLLPVEVDALEVRASIGYPDSGVGVRLGLGDGPVGVVARRKKLLRLASTAVPVRYAQALSPGASAPLTGLPSTQSLIVVPLLDGDELVGVLSIESPTALTFEAEDEKLVTTVANLAAAAIKNARLYHDLSEMHRSGQRFVPHEFVRFLDKNSLKDLARGANVSRVMTTLFSDLRAFTSLVEGLDPSATFDLLNHYFAAMVPPIQQQRGFVDKFIGDAIMALFDDVAADGALRAAVEEHSALARFNQLRGSRLGMGVGLHTGSLTLGVVGSEDRLSCTVYGDNVNLASRVEALTRTYGAAILLTGATYEALQDASAFALRYVDRVRVKGKEAAVDLWECLDALPAEERAERALGAALEEARLPYANGEFAAAAQAFESVVRQYPADPLPRLLLERCRRFALNPPLGWDGALRLDKK